MNTDKESQRIAAETICTVVREACNNDSGINRDGLTTLATSAAEAILAGYATLSAPQRASADRE